jgi:DtxR family transcriptional regulator, Mn-dependent transcriptional regulator
MLSFAEENYLKTIYHLSAGGRSDVSTNAIAEYMHTRAASVTDMIKKLSAKEMITYQKYKGVNISEEGKRLALQIVRKHRLWEVFLVEKLGFHWDEVHDVAEQLEHIKSPLLVRRLDEFLGFPKFDPHGDPIPDEHGIIKSKIELSLSDTQPGTHHRLAAVKDSNSAFLRYLDKIGLYIGAIIHVIDRVEFDGSMEVIIDQTRPLFISREVSNNLLVEEHNS